MGFCHDRRFYAKDPPFTSLREHFCDSEHLIADLGFIGDGKDCVCVFEKWQGLDFALRGVNNRIIRGVRLLNDCCDGHVTNRHRILLGRWPFDADLFSLAFKSCAMMASEVSSFRGFVLQTREKCTEKAAPYEARL